MPLIGSLLKRGIALSRFAGIRKKPDPVREQRKALLNLIEKARETEFGKHYGFGKILQAFAGNDPEAYYQAFIAKIPTCTYNGIYQDWWHRTVAGEPNVCWPGKTKYFALSSGTSEAATKHIPVTADMTRHIRKTSIRQIMTLAHYDLPVDFFTRGILMLGGSTQLNRIGYSYEGDLSGIQAKQLPFWFQPFYKPGKKIAKRQEWGAKLDEITLKAKDWDIGVVVGVPAWIQLLMEKIIAHYGVNTIHDIWPNLSIFTHGGVAFEPYKKGFEQLLGKPLVYLETYLASEGFIAYQARPESKGMKLVTDLGIFYEFVPFTDKNFGPDGELLPNAETLTLGQIKEGVDYAILLSTCAGAWRYLIGDTVRFVDMEHMEIIITGRTKHFLSLCGEHLSVDNMNRAVQLAADDFGIAIREFTVAGIPAGTLFGHHWFIGTDDAVDADKLIRNIDDHLKQLNDDYRTERGHALKELKITVLPTATFYGYLKSKGKEGGQIKFPRVMKKGAYQDWMEYIDQPA